jgi:hypothetical protein
VTCTAGKTDLLPFDQIRYIEGIFCILISEYVTFSTSNYPSLTKNPILHPVYLVSIWSSVMDFAIFRFRYIYPRVHSEPSPLRIFDMRPVYVDTGIVVSWLKGGRRRRRHRGEGYILAYKLYSNKKVTDDMPRICRKHLPILSSWGVIKIISTNLSQLLRHNIVFLCCNRR